MKKPGRLLIFLALALIGAFEANAQLTLKFDLIAFREYFGGNIYYAAPSLIASNAQTPVTFHRVQSASNVLSAEIATNLSSSAGYSSANLPDVINAITNGSWQLILNVGTTNAQTNTFRMSANFTTNTLGPLTILSPTNGAVLASNNPPYYWSAPTNWNRIWTFVGNDCETYSGGFASLATNATNWVTAPPLPDGNSLFTLNLAVDGTSWFSATTPTNTLGQPVSGWNFASEVSQQIQSQITVQPSSLPFLWAHYKFDEPDDFFRDSTCFGNRLTYYYGTPVYTNMAVSAGGIRLDGGEGLALPEKVIARLHGDFSISLWVKTIATSGLPNDPAPGQITVLGGSYSPGAADMIPIAITGSNAAFYTGAPGDTLRSTTPINSGDFTHLVITRERATGLKKLYINGALNVTGPGTTNLLTDTTDLILGANGLVGTLDDVQVYEGVLAADQVQGLFNNPGFPAPPHNPGATPAAIVAHYSFDNTNNFGEDISGQNNFVIGGTWCAGAGPVFTNSALAGYAAVFSGTNWLRLNTNVAAACASNFSVSMWVKTTNTFGSDSSPADQGAGLLSATDYSPPFYSVVPLALTGSKLGFMTSDSNYTDITVNSSASINTGGFVHVVATRDQFSGVMRLYVNGAPDGLAIGPTNPHSNFAALALGHMGNCFNGTASQIDEVQIYRGVLTPTQVQFLFQNPTEAIPLGDVSLAEALDTTNLTWTTGGDAVWMGQTLTSFDGIDAAQSGLITNGQNSYLQTTVTGPGTIQFRWRIASTNSDSIDLYINNSYQTSIYGDSGWELQSLPVPSGAQTLNWEFYKSGGDSNNVDRGWLDAFSFIPDLPTQVRFLSLTNVGTNFQFAFLTQSNRTHTVEFRNSMQTGAWLTLTSFIGNGSATNFIQPSSTLPQRFYRVSSE